MTLTVLRPLSLHPFIFYMALPSSAALFPKQSSFIHLHHGFLCFIPFSFPTPLHICIFLHSVPYVPPLPTWANPAARAAATGVTGRGVLLIFLFVGKPSLLLSLSACLSFQTQISNTSCSIWLSPAYLRYDLRLLPPPSSLPLFSYFLDGCCLSAPSSSPSRPRPEQLNYLYLAPARPGPVLPFPSSLSTSILLLFLPRRLSPFLLLPYSLLLLLFLLPSFVLFHVNFPL